MRTTLSVRVTTQTGRKTSRWRFPPCNIPIGTIHIRPIDNRLSVKPSMLFVMPMRTIRTATLLSNNQHSIKMETNRNIVQEQPAQTIITETIAESQMASAASVTTQPTDADELPYDPTEAAALSDTLPTDISIPNTSCFSAS